MGHIKQGMAIISTHDDHMPAVAAYDEKRNMVVLVCAAYYQDTAISFNFKHFVPAASSWNAVQVRQWTTRTDGTQRYVLSGGPVIQNQMLRFTVPKAALITLEVE